MLSDPVNSDLTDTVQHTDDDKYRITHRWGSSGGRGARRKPQLTKQCSTVSDGGAAIHPESIQVCRFYVYCQKFELIL